MKVSWESSALYTHVGRTSPVSPRSRIAFCSGPGPEPPTGPGALPVAWRLLSELLTDAPGVGVWDDGPTRPPAPFAGGGPDEEEMSRVAAGSALFCCLDFFPKRNDMA
jgi:hypothetical protein